MRYRQLLNPTACLHVVVPGCHAQPRCRLTLRSLTPCATSFRAAYSLKEPSNVPSSSLASITVTLHSSWVQGHVHVSLHGGTTLLLTRSTIRN